MQTNDIMYFLLVCMQLYYIFWLNILKGNVQFAIYLGNPLLVQMLADVTKELSGNRERPDNARPLMDTEHADEEQSLLLTRAAPKRKAESSVSEITDPRPTKQKEPADVKLPAKAK